MVLVVDAGKGIQTQTAECIVIGEVAAADMVVALNKTGAELSGAEGREACCVAVQCLQLQGELASGHERLAVPLPKSSVAWS